MSLTAGSGPWGHDPAGSFTQPLPPGVAYVEAYPRRVRGMLGGKTVVESERTLLVHVPGHPPEYAFPAADVHGDVGHRQEHAPGHISIGWYDLDAWYEEDEEIRGYHPRNPYHRIDCLPSTRHLLVEVGGEVLVDTDRVTILFETSTPPRVYVPRSAVRMELLRPSDTTWFCGYKGSAVYFTAVVGDVVVPDVAWSYVDTLLEGTPIKDMLCFDVDKARLTGELLDDWKWRN
jgi:uncharacterized protein (DUF427 family)